MGKHDKQSEFKWDMPEISNVQEEQTVLKISYQPPKDDFYKARISTLERENQELYSKLAKEEEANAREFDMKMGIIGELREELAELKEENAKLKDMYIKAVMK